MNQTESGFWKRLKKRLESSYEQPVVTRVENSSTPGIPDLILCDSKKNIHLIELKVTKGNKVNISPHQVSFATRHHSARVWMLIEKQSTDQNQCYLYRSNSVMKLAELGIKEVQPDLIFDLAQDAETFLCWLKNSKKLDTLHESDVKTATCFS